MQITTDIVLDLKRPNINTIVHAKQNDKLSRYVNAALMDGPQPWTPPAGVLATVRFKKPDGHAGFYDVDENEDPAVVFTGSTAKITLAEQAISCPGNVLMELTMYTAAGERLSTFLFVLEVEESALTDEEIESTDYYSILTIQIAEVLAKIDSVAGITAEAESIPYGEETYVVVTGGTGTEDPYFLHFYIESARPLNPRGTYSASATYNKLDFVLYNGSSYVAMRDGITGVTPGTSVEEWQMLASGITITSQTYTYAAQTEAQYTGNPPSSGWQNTIPSPIAGGFLWTKITTHYSDGKELINYSVVKNGTNGAATAEDITYDTSLAYSNGTVGKELKTQSSKIEDLETNKVDKTAISNQNFLINPWFNVNQRGVTSYSVGAYGVDRWKLVSGSASVNSDGTITLNGTLRQILENSIGTDDCVCSVICVSGNATASYDDETKYFDIVAAGATIKCAKLELGSVSSLANDSILDYNIELLKCQRYYVVIGGATGFFGWNGIMYCRLTLPTILRTTPTGRIDAVSVRVAGKMLTGISYNAFASMQGTAIDFNLKLSQTDDSVRNYAARLEGFIYFDAEI